MKISALGNVSAVTRCIAKCRICRTPGRQRGDRAMPTPPLVAPVSPAPQARSTPGPELRLCPVNGTPQRVPVAQVYGGILLNGSLSVPTGPNGTMPAGTNGLFGSMRVPGSPAGGPFANGLAGSMRVNVFHMFRLLKWVCLNMRPKHGGVDANTWCPGPERPEGAMMPLFGSMRVPSPERHEGEVLSGAQLDQAKFTGAANKTAVMSPSWVHFCMRKEASVDGCSKSKSAQDEESASMLCAAAMEYGYLLSNGLEVQEGCSCSTPLWAAPSRGSPQQPGRPVPAPCVGYAVPTPYLPTKRPESPMMNHLRHLGTLNPSPEYQHLLNIVMTQEQAKQDLLDRLEETERQLQQCRMENEMLRNGQNFRSSSVTSKTMRSVAEGKEDSVNRTRSGSMRMRRSNSSRPRFTDSLVVPFSGKEALQDRFAVERAAEHDSDLSEVSSLSSSVSLQDLRLWCHRRFEEKKVSMENLLEARALVERRQAELADWISYAERKAREEEGLPTLSLAAKHRSAVTTASSVMQAGYRLAMAREKFKLMKQTFRAEHPGCSLRHLKLQAGSAATAGSTAESSSGSRAVGPAPIAQETPMTPMETENNIGVSENGEWQTCLHVGTMNGLQSGETMTISRFFKGKSKSNSGQRIIKAVRKSQVPFFRLLEQHIGDQRSFDHPHVCRLIDAFEDEEHVYQVFEFLSGPSLLEKILSDTQFSERDAAAATKAILLAIGYLHGLSIAHQNVHLENLRFATHPRKKESGSCYCDQLKLMDLGLSLNRKLIPGILNAASQPATESSATLPLLAPLGIQNSLGSVCLPPECQGVCSSYAQLATAAPCMLRRTDSTQLHRSPSPTLQRKTSEDFGQTSSISSVSQDSSSRRAKELLLLLQAGDVWSAGCILHILLSGQIPVTVVDSDKGGDVPKLPLLLGVSAGAIDTCAMLLHGMPRRRATAETALENNWFSQCEHIQKAHRSQKRNLSLAAPRSPEFFEKLRQTSAMTCLRRLFHSVRAVRNGTSLAIPGPEEDNKDSGTNARAAADAMCAEAFEWLLFSSGATSAGGIPLRKLNSMIQSVIQSESKVPRNDLEMRVDTLISSTQFAEMIWATCA
eukprot:s763_g10.t3